MLQALHRQETGVVTRNSARRTRMKHTHMIGFALAAALCAGPATAQELTGTLKNIKETGAITLGHRDSSIPFSYLDDNQKPIGQAQEITYDKASDSEQELDVERHRVDLGALTMTTS